MMTGVGVECRCGCVGVLWLVDGSDVAQSIFPFFLSTADRKVSETCSALSLVVGVT